MSSTATVLDRPASPALPGPLTPPDPLVPIDPEDRLTPVPASPSLPSILFPDFSLSPSDPTDSPDAEAPATAPFMVTDLSSASWAAAKVLEAQARMADRSQLAASYKARIDSWLSSSNAQDESSSAYLSLLLKPFIEAELSRTHSRSRTLHLLTASASLRKGQDHVEILDDAAAMAYLEANHPSAVVTKKTILLSTLRSLLFTQGEAVPGVEASLGSDSLYLKPRA